MTDPVEVAIEEIVQRAVAVEGIAVPASFLSWTQGGYGTAWPTPDEIRSFADAVGMSHREIFLALLASVERGPNEQQSVAMARQERDELKSTLEGMVAAGEISQREARRALRRRR